MSSALFNSRRFENPPNDQAQRAHARTQALKNSQLTTVKKLFELFNP